MQQSNKRNSRMHSMWTFLVKVIGKQRIMLIGTSLILLGIICIIIGSIQTLNASRSRIVNLRMEDIGELSTQAAYFTNVQVISNSRQVFGVEIPFTQNKYIYSYDGVIKAGIDFAQLTYTINSNNKTITINIPQAHITSVSVDENSLEIYDETNNIFTPLKLNDIQDTRLKMENEAKEQAIANGLLSEATENAKVLIRAFLFSNNELDDHEIIWKILNTEE